MCRKARYVEYTDDTFVQRRPVDPAWAHVGIMGPVLRAEVGDELRVVFMNKADRPYTMHPHGVVYLKPDEVPSTSYTMHPHGVVYLVYHVPSTAWSTPAPCTLFDHWF